MAYFLCLDRGISFVFVDFFSPFSSFFVKNDNVVWFGVS